MNKRAAKGSHAVTTVTGMRSRLPMLLAAVIPATLVLAACTPSSIGTVGLQRQEDGSVKALIRMCHGSVDELVLRPVNSFPTGTGGEALTDTWDSTPDLSRALASAVGGDADVADALDEADLLPDVLYEMSARGREGNATSGFFGGSELAALGADQVLTYPRRGSEGVHEILTPTDFEEAADDFCRTLH
jgi:hypothetical protein